MTDDPRLGRDQIRGLLQDLSTELEAEGVQAEMFVVGGAAIALAYNTRRITADVDAVFEPKAVVYAAAARVAERHPGVPALLALKIQASRVDRDVDDIRFLARMCGATTANAVLDIATRVLGHENLAPKAQYVVQELFPPGAPETDPDPTRRFER